MAEQPHKVWASVSERALKGRTGGGWLIINDRDLLVDRFIDLERLGRETGALREYERLEG
jgi:hypothetical protein